MHVIRVNIELNPIKYCTTASLCVEDSYTHFILLIKLIIFIDTIYNIN